LFWEEHTAAHHVYGWTPAGSLVGALVRATHPDPIPSQHLGDQFYKLLSQKVPQGAVRGWVKVKKKIAQGDLEIWFPKKILLPQMRIWFAQKDPPGALGR
jgi:hypothetical protein